jgi:MFS family permease
MPPQPLPRSSSAWAPLSVAAFRSLWLALLASNIGTWMQTVGAQWQLVESGGSDFLVSLVQTASMLPIVLLALPSGALADTFDRRRMLLTVQSALCAVAVLLAALTATDHMPPALLLTLTFALGAGQALTVPAWQAIIPELVPRAQLPAASALGAISQNLARAIGPAIAGLVIATLGVAAVFALNAVSFVVFAAVLLWWRPPDGETGPPERFAAAVRAGGRYVRHSVVVRRIHCSCCRVAPSGPSCRWSPAAGSASVRAATGCCWRRSASVRWPAPPCCPGCANGSRRTG